MIEQSRIFVLNMEEVMAIAEARHDNPHHILGMHACLDDLYVNAYIRGVHAVHVVDLERQTEYPMHMEITDGFYTVKIPDRKPFPYQLKFFWEKWDDTGNVVQETRTVYDAYSFSHAVDPVKVMDVVTDHVDPAEGFRIKDLLGARETVVNGISGTVFCMNMPGAKRVSVVGDFNDWDGRVHPMRRIDYTSLFELFLPYELTGSCYKFEALYGDGHIDVFADPYAAAYEKKPGDASVLADLDYRWQDKTYMEGRKQPSARAISIYEVHLPTWRPVQSPDSTYAELGKEIAAYVKRMGYQYVEFMPLMEYQREDFWGYDTTGVYAPTSRFGSPVDFMAMVDEFHRQGIGVIMDMVPLTDADCMMYWVDTYHLDGIRLDSEDMFFEWKRVTGKAYDPVLVFYKWNQSGCYALLDYMRIRPEKRENLWEFLEDRQAEFSEEAGILSLSHDLLADGAGSLIERMPGGYEDKFADLRLLYGLLMALPGNKLMFMGQELGLSGGFNGQIPLDWSMLDFDANRYLTEYVKELNKLFMEETAFSGPLSESGFEVIKSGQEQVACFVRKTKKQAETCYVLCNFGLTDRKSFDLPVKAAGCYCEIFSSDMIKFGGEGNHNKTVKKAVKRTSAYELELQLPALSVTIIKREHA